MKGGYGARFSCGARSWVRVFDRPLLRRRAQACNRERAEMEARRVTKMRVFLLTNVSTQGTIVGAFVSEDAAKNYIADVDPGRVFTWQVREVAWYDNYGES